MPTYYTYILRSEKTGRLYIGQTNNLEDRLHRHNSGQSKSTKAGIPYDLLHCKEFKSRTEAVLLERKLKSWKSPSKVLEWIVRQSG
ncbi:MAG TPA: GIY-YIG nuclease family protein [Fulvivirga sp.]|nr:GIY-YIG nuclease family protein [Fulvivirga sp.]